jgi:hypothetical protein
MEQVVDGEFNPYIPVEQADCIHHRRCGTVILFR